MLTKYRAVILIMSLIMVIVMTVQLFYTASIAAGRLSIGAVRDSGTFPKRGRNVNAYYRPRDADVQDTADSYPVVRTHGSNVNSVSRIIIATTTECPIFRQTDTGQTNPPIIG